MPIWIEEVRWASHQDVLQSIRHAVFIIEQGIDPADEWDHRDATCRHFLGYLTDGAQRCSRMAHGAESLGHNCQAPV